MAIGRPRTVEKVSLTCRGCGNPFEVYPSVAARGRACCSTRCERRRRYGTTPEDANRGRWPSGKFKRTSGARARKNELRRVDRTKDRARDAVRKALRTGALVKGPCERCGSLKVEAHHADYAQPLVVRWLCQPHHREADIELGLRAI